MSAKRPRRSTSGTAARYNAAEVFADMLGESNPPGHEQSNAPEAGPSGSRPGKGQRRGSVSSGGGSDFEMDKQAEEDEAAQDQEDEDQDVVAEEQSEPELESEPRPVPQAAPKKRGQNKGKQVEREVSVRVLDDSPSQSAAANPSQPTTSAPRKPSIATAALKSEPKRASVAAPGGKKAVRNKSGGDSFWRHVTSALAASGSIARPGDKRTGGPNARLLSWQEEFGFEGPDSASYLSCCVPPAHAAHAPRSEPAQALAEVGLAEVDVNEDRGQLKKVVQGWSRAPFGPRATLAMDLGWYKGKLTAPQRWGGWHANLKRKQDRFQKIPYEQALAYFPRREVEDPDQGMDVEQDAAAAGADVDMDPAAAPEGTIACWLGFGEPGQEGVAKQEGDENPAKAEQSLHELERLSAMRLDTALPDKPGHLLNAGGPVWTLDWCPQADILQPAPREYLALGTMTDDLPVGAFAATAFTAEPGPLRGLIQIWSFDVSSASERQRVVDEDMKDRPTAKFDLGMCVDVGQPWALQWCPRGGHAEDQAATSLGLLAGVFTDGKVHIFDVPKLASEPAEYHKAQPILSLSIPDTSCTCLDWASHDRLIVGCENGHIAVFDVGASLSSDEANCPPVKRPSFYIPSHEGALRSVKAVRNPPADVDGQVMDDHEPHVIMSTGYDGGHCLVDLRDVHTGNTIARLRTVSMDASYDCFLGCPITTDAEHGINSLFLRPQSHGTNRRIVQHNGTVWSLSSSNFHPYVASTAADGSCHVSNSIRRLNSKHSIQYSNVVYRIDYNRRTGHYRMVDNLAPETQRASTTYEEDGKVKKKARQGAELATGAWLPEVGVLSSSWGKSLHRPCLLASGTYCGLVRVDWSEGPTREKDVSDMATLLSSATSASKLEEEDELA